MTGPGAGIFQIDFEPPGKRLSCAHGKSLLECARSHGIGIASVCGGHGSCRSCKVKVVQGMVSPPTSTEIEAFSTEELNGGWRLACQTHPMGDCKLHVPPESMTAAQRTQTEGVAVVVAPEPVVSIYSVELPSPSHVDLRADAERLTASLRSVHGVNCGEIDIDALRFLPDRMYAADWQPQIVIRGREIISVGGPSVRLLGLAVDLGSTKIAGYLVDLKTGETLAARGIINPQISYGEDIISRLNLAIESEEERKRLQDLVTVSIDRMAADLSREINARTSEIADAVIVGNTAMHHLALGLPVRQLVQAPFVPAVNQALDIKARDMGLHLSPGSYVHWLPNIAGFVGADHVAVLLATAAEWGDGPALVLDIGTNTEVSLIAGGKITSASCASGPAFEGGHIKDGMRAGAGAIERVRLHDDAIQYETIDGAPPVGICGSGILDTVAQMYLAGIVDASGRMGNHSRHVSTGAGMKEFVLVDGRTRGGRTLVFTQKDVRQLQLAKAAIRAGIQMLLEANHLTEDRLDRIIIAGAFGSYIDVASAIAAGMLPALPRGHFKQIGNAAGMGARMALVSRRQRRRASGIASRVRYIELSAVPDFSRTFTSATYLGSYRLRHGLREEIR